MNVLTIFGVNRYGYVKNLKKLKKGKRRKTNDTLRISTPTNEKNENLAVNWKCRVLEKNNRG